MTSTARAIVSQSKDIKADRVAASAFRTASIPVSYCFIAPTNRSGTPEAAMRASICDATSLTRSPRRRNSIMFRLRVLPRETKTSDSAVTARSLGPQSHRMRAHQWLALSKRELASPDRLDCRGCHLGSTSKSQVQRWQCRPVRKARPPSVFESPDFAFVSHPGPRFAVFTFDTDLILEA